MTGDYDYDFLVIGGGSGGVRAARMAAEFGARAAVVEMARLGGTCVNVGCVPKKFLVYAAQVARDAEDARGYGWQMAELTHDWSALMAGKDQEIERLNGVYARILERAGARQITGRACLRDAHTVEVAGQTYTARYILLATGGRPYLPPGPAHALAATSDEMFGLSSLPRRIVVAGGGYIAAEFACIFHGLGSEVTLVHRRERLLRGFDEDVRDHVTDALRAQGIQMALPRTILEIRSGSAGEKCVRLDDGTELVADEVLCAMGRQPLTEGLGLDAAGVKLNDAGAVVVDGYSRTNVPNIFAVGDVTDRINLTPVAISEGAAVAQTLFNNTPTRPDHRDVPSAVFTMPSVGSVGLTEAEAREKYGQVRIFRSSFRALRHALTGRKEKTLMKLVVAAETDRVVGLHMVGEHAGEIVQGFAVAIKMGATKAQFDQTMAIHPTAAEEFVTMRNPTG